MGFVKNFYPCFLTLAMDIVGGKWKMVILWHLRNGILRFNEIRRLMPGITQRKKVDPCFGYALQLEHHLCRSAWNIMRISNLFWEGFLTSFIGCFMFKA